MPFWIALIIVVFAGIGGGALYLMRRNTQQTDEYEAGGIGMQLQPAEDIYAMAGVAATEPPVTNYGESELETLNQTNTVAPIEAETNEYGQTPWADELGNTWGQNPDGSIMRFDTESGTWVPHQ